MRLIIWSIVISVVEIFPRFVGNIYLQLYTLKYNCAQNNWSWFCVFVNVYAQNNPYVIFAAQNK